MYLLFCTQNLSWVLFSQGFPEKKLQSEDSKNMTDLVEQLLKVKYMRKYNYICMWLTLLLQFMT